jgi:hypothetical protein
MPIIPGSRANSHQAGRGPEFRLVSEILRLSVATSWEIARQEWFLLKVYDADNPTACLCGHRPIVECCVLQNPHNGNEAIVGSVCVTQFIGIPAEKLFAALRRISSDPSTSLGIEVVDYAHGEGWISAWEQEFCHSTHRRRKLTARQLAIRAEINAKVRARYRREDRPDA